MCCGSKRSPGVAGNNEGHESGGSCGSTCCDYQCKTVPPPFNASRGCGRTDRVRRDSSHSYLEIEVGKVNANSAPSRGWIRAWTFSGDQCTSRYSVADCEHAARRRE